LPPPATPDECSKYHFEVIKDQKEDVAGGAVLMIDNPGMDEDLIEHCGYTQYECCWECQEIHNCQGFAYDPGGCTKPGQVGDSVCQYRKFGDFNVVPANLVVQPSAINLKLFRLADRPPSAPPPSPPPAPPPEFSFTVDGSDPHVEKGVQHDHLYTMTFTGDDGPQQGDWVVWVRKDYYHNDPPGGTECEGAGALAAKDAALFVARQKNET
jgi:hypothetical protein